MKRPKDVKKELEVVSNPTPSLERRVEKPKIRQSSVPIKVKPPSLARFSMNMKEDLEKVILDIFKKLKSKSPYLMPLDKYHIMLSFLRNYAKTRRSLGGWESEFGRGCFCCLIKETPS